MYKTQQIMILTIVTIFVSLSLFYYFMQKNRIRQEQRREAREEKHEELMQLLRNIKNNEPGVQEGDNNPNSEAGQQTTGE